MAHIRDELLEAGKVRRLAEVLRVLVQPGTQDGGDGAAGSGGETQASLCENQVPGDNHVHSREHPHEPQEHVWDKRNNTCL